MKVRRKLPVIITSIILVAALVLTAVAYSMAGSIDAFFMTPTADVSAEVKEETVSEARALAEDIEEEGIVLLQNEDETLPLSPDVTKVNVFGWASTAWLGGGSGSGRISGVETDFLDALTAYGIEYNTELTDMYRDFQDGREYTDTLDCSPKESARLYEPDINDERYYTEELLENAQDYSDTAIVVIGRLAGGESNDVPSCQYKIIEKGGDVVLDDTRSTLELSTEEESLLSYAGSHFENVIVVLNTTNVMTIGAVETTEGVDACITAGLTGTEAASAVPRVLWGEVSPSGRTADTWAYALRSAASYANSGENGVGAYTDAEGLYPADGTENVSLGDGSLYTQVSYIDYAESIYVGYRWYETADAEGFWDEVENEYGDGYDGVVQYPFGFGLSYTSFEWEIISAPAEDTDLEDYETLRFVVKVTNTGEYAGKDVVQLYYTAPYYEGGIEKASVVLADYAKTGTLAPGESETVTLELQVSDMASYDCYDANENGFCGYELDAGGYIFTIRTDAHTAAEADGASVTLNLSENIQYPCDADTGAAVGNLFTGDDADCGVGIDGVSTGQEIAYLTRADFEGTFPEENDDSRAIPDVVAALNLYDAAQESEGTAGESADDTGGANADSAEGGGAEEKTGGKALKIEEDGLVTDVGLVLGSDFDDPLWDELLDQLSLSEMTDLFTNGYGGTAAVESVGKLQGVDADGPAQAGSFNRISTSKVGFPSLSTVSQTWNDSIALEMGHMQGRLALISGYSGIYGPTANIHRSPYGGRNYEYYSEDPLLTGRMCGNTVQGIQEAGVYVYVKHFIGNDTEAGIYRDGVYTWMTEQALRELYLEPFRMAVEEYDAVGIMTSYNRLGAVWTGGSSALISGVLRGEWGFDGAVITDYADHHEYMNGDQALLAGGSLWMAGFGGGSMEGGTSSADYEENLRRAAKETLYMYLHVRVINNGHVEESGDTDIQRPAFHDSVIGWREILLITDAAAAILFAFAVLYSRRKNVNMTGRRKG